MPLPSAKVVAPRADLNRAAAALLRRYPAANKLVAAMLDRLAEVENGELPRRTDEVPPGGKRVKRFYRKGDAVQGYRVEGMPYDERLEEVRRDSAFKCPQNVYRAAARVFARAPQEGIRWHDVEKAICQRLEYKPPDYQARIAVRFWLSRDPPLLIRYSTWIRPTLAGGFVNETEKLWRSFKRRTALQARKKT